jgi:hypothetical protein
MSNVPEEAGKVATSAIDAMKANPSCLAALIVVGIFAALSFFGNQRDAERKTKTIDILLNRCYPAPAGDYHPPKEVEP